MKGTCLGAFEELVLLTVADLMEEAYNVAVYDDGSNHMDRSIKTDVVPSRSALGKYYLACIEKSVA